MKLDLDRQSIDIPCPHCRGKISETIGKLKTNPKLTCRHCRQSFNVEANQLRAGIQQAEKAFADLQRSLGRLGK